MLVPPLLLCVCWDDVYRQKMSSLFSTIPLTAPLQTSRFTDALAVAAAAAAAAEDDDDDDADV